jgi:hypothetical protein
MHAHEDVLSRRPCPEAHAHCRKFNNSQAAWWYDLLLLLWMAGINATLWRQQLDDNDVQPILQELNRVEH